MTYINTYINTYFEFIVDVCEQSHCNNVLYYACCTICIVVIVCAGAANYLVLHCKMMHLPPYLLAVPGA